MRGSCSVTLASTYGSRKQTGRILRQLPHRKLGEVQCSAELFASSSAASYLCEGVAGGLHEGRVERAADRHRYRLERALGGGLALHLLQRVLVPCHRAGRRWRGGAPGSRVTVYHRQR